MTRSVSSRSASIVLRGTSTTSAMRFDPNRQTPPGVNYSGRTFGQTAGSVAGEHVRVRQPLAAQALLELVEVRRALLVAHGAAQLPLRVEERLAGRELRGLPGHVAGEMQRVEVEPAAVLLQELARELAPVGRGDVGADDLPLRVDHDVDLGAADERLLVALHQRLEDAARTVGGLLELVEPDVRAREELAEGAAAGARALGAEVAEADLGLEQLHLALGDPVALGHHQVRERVRRGARARRARALLADLVGRAHAPGDLVAELARRLGRRREDRLEHLPGPLAQDLLGELLRDRLAGAGLD